MREILVIVGSGGHAVSVASVASACGFEVIGFWDDDRYGQTVDNFKVLSKLDLARIGAIRNMALGIGDNSQRNSAFYKVSSEFPDVEFPALVHPSSTIGEGATIGRGVVIMPQSNIGPSSRVSDFCVINSSSSVDHHCTMEEFSSVAPGVIFGGRVTLGRRSAVGISAVVRHNISIGSDAVIGAKSYVNADIQSNTVAFGVPCKAIRSRAASDPYL